MSDVIVLPATDRNVPVDVIDAFNVFDLETAQPIGRVAWMFKPETVDDPVVWGFITINDNDPDPHLSQEPYLSVGSAVDALLRFATTGQE